MLNKVELMGRLTAQPELKHTASGTPVCTITLAVQRDHKNAEGTYTTDFVECVTWQDTAKFVCKSFTKGQMAAITGSLESRKWSDKNGNNRVSWEIRVERIYFCDSKREGTPTPAPPQTAVAGSTQPAAVHPTLNDAFADVFPDDEDVPF